MPRKLKIYAVYKGDNFVCTGTAKECAEKIGIKITSFRYLTHPAYKKRFAKKIKSNALDVFVLEDED